MYATVLQCDDVELKPEMGVKDIDDEDYGADFITLTDDEGNEFELEYVDTVEYKGNLYMVFFPTLEEGQDEDDEDFGLIILRCVPGAEDGSLESVDDDDELNAVYDVVMETLFDEDEDEDDYEDEDDDF